MPAGDFLTLIERRTECIEESWLHILLVTLALVLPCGSSLADDAEALAVESDSRVEQIQGWTLQVSGVLLREQPEQTRRALELLDKQLQEVVEKVPAEAVTELRKVPLWFSPEYPQIRPRAEYHPNAGWLRRNGRNPAMAKAVEFTNVRIFERETRRMPNFALHELAHAFHDRVLEQGFANGEIQAMFERAKANASYESVERRDAQGRSTRERSYAMTSPQEYFAECTEAYFSRNDFFPFTREQLREHDPAMFELLGKLWGVRETLE